MALPAMPHPHLIILRTAATVVISCLVGQAGWAAAFIGDDPGYRRFHELGAWVTVAAAVVTAVIYLALRRSAGSVNVTLAILVAVGTVTQVALAESGSVAAHIFVGVLLAMLGTALTSWTYRHRMPENAS